MRFEKETNITLFSTVVVLAFTNGLCYFRWQESVEQARVLAMENQVLKDKSYHGR